MIAPAARPPMTPAAIAPPRAEAGLAGAVATSAAAATAARVIIFNMVFASPMWRGNTPRPDKFRRSQKNSCGGYWQVADDTIGADLSGCERRIEFTRRLHDPVA